MDSSASLLPKLPPAGGRFPLTRTNAGRLLFILAGLGVFTFCCVSFAQNGVLATATVAYLGWTQSNGAAAAAAFAGVYAVCVFCMVPAVIFMLGGGYAFSRAYGPAAGVALSSTVVMCGALVGGAAAFLAGRFAFRGAVESLSRRYVLIRAVDAALGAHGFKLLCLLWLSPVLPWNVLNYLLAGTAIPFYTFVAACVGMVPETVLWCYFGSLLNSATAATSSSQPAAARYGLLAGGGVLAAVTLVALTVYAKREVAKILAETAEREGRADGAAGGAV